MLAGQLSYLDGARALLRFGAQAGLDDDPDLEVFTLIESETGQLPVGQLERLVARFAGKSPTTTEILMRRMLEWTCGQQCVDWAVGMLERGYASRSLLLLAGLASPLNHFEVRALRDRALEEIRPPELAIDDPINAYVADTLAESLWEIGALRGALVRVAQLAIELGYPDDLQPLFNLHCAFEDLARFNEQWSWHAATRENIDELMLREARRFIARYAG